MIFPSLIIKVERWKFNKEYGVYVSTLGNFKDRHKRRLPIRIDSKKGYCRVKTERGVPFAHRLVMLTWKPIPDAENLTVDHLNHNKRDNSLQNLEWVTAEENYRRAKEDLVPYDEVKAEVKTKVEIESGTKVESLSKEEILRGEKKARKARNNELFPLIKEELERGKKVRYVVSGNAFTSVEEAAEWVKNHLPKSILAMPDFDVNTVHNSVETIYKNCYQAARANRITRRYGFNFAVTFVD